MGFVITGPEQTIAGRAVKTFFTEQTIFSVQISQILDALINNYDEGGATTVIDLEAGAGDETANFPAGAVVYVFCESGAGFKGRGVIQTSVHGAPHAGQTTLTFTELLGMGTTAVIDVDDYLYVISNKVGRFFKLQTQDLLTDISGTLYVHPDETGLIQIDVGPIIQDYLRANTLLDVWYSFFFGEGVLGAAHGTDYQALDGSLSFQQESATGSASYIFMLINPGGASDPGCWPLTRFLNRPKASAPSASVFARPRIWENWSTNIYYIADPDLTDMGVTMHIQVNGIYNDKAPVSEATQAFTTATTDPQVIEYALPTVWADSSVIGFEVFFSDTTTRADADKQIYFAVEAEPCNPIMVKWRNELGGYSYWLFGIDQTSEFTTTKKGTYKTFTTDIGASAGTTKEIDTGSMTQRMTLTSNQLTFGQIRALSGIFKSSEVTVFLDKTETRTINVTVPQQSYLLQSKTRMQDKRVVNVGDQSDALGSVDGVETLSLDIDFPAGFDFYENIDY